MPSIAPPKTQTNTIKLTMIKLIFRPFRLRAFAFGKPHPVRKHTNCTAARICRKAQYGLVEPRPTSSLLLIVDHGLEPIGVLLRLSVKN